MGKSKHSQKRDQGKNFYKRQRRINQLEYIEIINKNEPQKYMRHKLTKFRKNRQFYNNTWRSQHPTFSNVRKARENNDREVEGLNYTITLVDLPDLYRELHPTIALFSKAHTTLSQTDHTNSHKISLKKFQTVEIIQSISLDSNGKKIGISNWRKMENSSNMWKLNNTVLNNKWIKE